MERPSSCKRELFEIKTDSKRPDCFHCGTVTLTVGWVPPRPRWSFPSLAAGAAGGATFGFFAGLVLFFPNFYSPLVFNGFPYYLSWCWGGITVIGFVILGAVAGLIYKE